MWVVHPLSMAASLCLKVILGGNTLLEWQTYTVDLNNGSLLILLNFFSIINLLMSSFFLVFFITTTSGILFCCILDVPSIGLRTLETGVGTLVPVGVTVVDARTIPWSGRTTPGSLSVYHPLMG